MVVAVHEGQQALEEVQAQEQHLFTPRVALHARTRSFPTPGIPKGFFFYDISLKLVCVCVFVRTLIMSSLCCCSP